jgi:threonyl-tRNA synthetase
MSPEGREALLLLGCPEVPVQQALALHLLGRLKAAGYAVTCAGNPAVLQLLRVSDPDRHYVGPVVEIERYIGELAEGRRSPELCIAFAHSDAGLTFAATARYMLPDARFVLLVFGREAEALAEQVTFPCEKIVDVAVHNPTKLKRKIDEVVAWAA